MPHFLDIFNNIDVHAHVGNYKGNPNFSGSLSEVRSCARKAGVEFTIVSHYEGLFYQDTDMLLKANETAYAMVQNKHEMGMWLVLDPNIDRSWKQAEEMIKFPKCMGIKIHPECHNYDIVRHIENILNFCAHRKAIVLTHSGYTNSSPLAMAQAANNNRDAILIMAHLGNEPEEYNSVTHIRAILSSKYENLYVDTSSSRNIYHGYLENAVAKIGSQRILFGSDSPIHFTPAQVARISMSDLTRKEKKGILGGNFKRIWHKK